MNVSVKTHVAQVSVGGELSRWGCHSPVCCSPKRFKWQDVSNKGKRGRNATTSCHFASVVVGLQGVDWLATRYYKHMIAARFVVSGLMILK